jgi:flagellar L-ring protein precursor FlgH
LGLAALAFAGCTTMQPPEDAMMDFPEPPPVEANGAIYQSGRDVPLFENTTAHRVGDTITIRLEERTQAQKSSSTSTSKSTSANVGGISVAGRPVTKNGVEILNGSIDSETAFDGQGDSAQSNRLEGSITVMVQKRLPNGNLYVRGQKWISINQGREYVKVEGIVRPVDIDPDNSIASTKVGNAQISYGAKGALADANRPGLLARFFNFPWLPF